MIVIGVSGAVFVAFLVLAALGGVFNGITTLKIREQRKDRVQSLYESAGDPPEDAP